MASTSSAATASHVILTLIARAPPFEDRLACLQELGLGEHALEVKSFSDCTYCNVKAAGVSLAFDGNGAQASQRLACIHVTHPSSIGLPHGLGLGMTGKELVEMHGEPGSKGGGSSIGAIFVSYPALGFQANFERPEWVAHNKIAGFDIFSPKSPAKAGAAEASAAQEAAAPSLAEPAYELTSGADALTLTVHLPLAASMEGGAAQQRRGADEEHGCARLGQSCDERSFFSAQRAFTAGVHSSRSQLKAFKKVYLNALDE